MALNARTVGRVELNDEPGTRPVERAPDTTRVCGRLVKRSGRSNQRDALEALGALPGEASYNSRSGARWRGTRTRRPSITRYGPAVLTAPSRQCSEKPIGWCSASRPAEPWWTERARRGRAAGESSEQALSERSEDILLSDRERAEGFLPNEVRQSSSELALTVFYAT